MKRGGRWKSRSASRKPAKVRRGVRLVLLAFPAGTPLPLPAPDLALSRYKYVVQVTLGEVKKQGVRVASRCLWDTDNDNYSSYSFKNVRRRRGGLLMREAHTLPLRALSRRSPCGAAPCCSRATLSEGGSVRGQCTLSRARRKLLHSATATLHLSTASCRRQCRSCRAAQAP